MDYYGNVYFYFCDHPGVLKIVNMNGNILHDILLIRISWVPIVVSVYLRNKIYLIIIFPPILNYYYPMKG